jgi:hypothetical protein
MAKSSVVVLGGKVAAVVSSLKRRDSVVPDRGAIWMNRIMIASVSF